MQGAIRSIIQLSIQRRRLLNGAGTQSGTTTQSMSTSALFPNSPQTLWPAERRLEIVLEQGPVVERMSGLQKFKTAVLGVVMVTSALVFAFVAVQIFVASAILGGTASSLEGLTALVQAVLFFVMATAAAWLGFEKLFELRISQLALAYQLTAERRHYRADEFNRVCSDSSAFDPHTFDRRNFDRRDFDQTASDQTASDRAASARAASDRAASDRPESGWHEKLQSEMAWNNCLPTVGAPQA